MSQETTEHKVAGELEIMREIVVSAVGGSKPAAIAETALRNAGKLVGLTAAALNLWDENQAVILSVNYFQTEQEQAALIELEHDVYASLRKNRKLVSAYISFGGERPISTFTLPLKRANKILGAVIGVQPGIGTLVREDIFLEALTAALSLAFIGAGLTPRVEDIDTRIKKERINAIIETATTVNHEINNPLTAVLGNVQLLLLKGESLDEELRKKLKVVEESALRIREVTQKLMNITRDDVTEYVDGVKMIDLSGEGDASPSGPTRPGP